MLIKRYVAQYIHRVEDIKQKTTVVSNMFLIRGVCFKFIYYFQMYQANKTLKNN